MELTKKQIEVLRMSAEGLTSKMIADKLGKSTRNIQNMKDRIFLNTDTRNITHAVATAIRKNII